MYSDATCVACCGNFVVIAMKFDACPHDINGYQPKNRSWDLSLSTCGAVARIISHPGTRNANEKLWMKLASWNGLQHPKLLWVGRSFKMVSSLEMLRWTPGPLLFYRRPGGIQREPPQRSLRTAHLTEFQVRKACMQSSRWVYVLRHCK